MGKDSLKKNERAMWATVYLVLVLIILLLLSGCTTSYIEFEGECVQQRWNALGYTVRLRQICDLPKPSFEGLDDRVIRDKEPMDVNPFPDLIGEENPADSMDPDLLEKQRLRMLSEPESAP